MMTGEYFATHGLVSGDLERFAQSQAEPALVLTIPESRLISIMGCFERAKSHCSSSTRIGWFYRLAIRGRRQTWCRGTSGLARAFFYAGARSLIVSHWEV